MKVKEDQLLVIFGASGDLTSRKLMPALFEIYRQHVLPSHFAILGVGRKPYTTEKFREKVVTAITRHTSTHENSDQHLAAAFAGLVHYLPLNTENPEEYHVLAEKIQWLEDSYQTGGNCLFYLATPPGLYEVIANGLRNNELQHHPKAWRRIIIEKPFGISLKSAKALNNHLLNCFNEDQVYRIDHYLGKETVQNVMVTRFSNGIFEPLWNRNYIHHVEITSAENMGVEDRGGYYDKAGALRDMVQNHLLQLVSLVAMEPPTQISADAIRNETLKVLQSIRPFTGEEITSHVIRGQYTASTVRGVHCNAYRDEPGVNRDSRTETYVALKLYIDNWRWGGVPFYIRTGKYLPAKVTEVVVHFKPTPHRLFCFNENVQNADNQLVIRIQPDEGILLKFGMKVPGAGFQVQDVNMDFHYADLAQKNIPEAYQRLLVDCMQGDATLFTRGDSILQAWKIVDPILNEWEKNPDIPIYGYPAGTWGPIQADNLIDGPNMTWRFPCKNLSDDGKYCEL
ncbi:MAG: glucose-6-phosphate dehydrogenase [Bacteroidales bacterium]|nr:glucose-6-phosphate dehydrogenase [Bacteroidales bacterium]